MHPGFIHHWRRRQRAAEGRAAYYGCYGGGAGNGLRWDASRRFGDAAYGAAGFGARRPVRFLALRLDLDDAQVAKLAKIVERLRVEREQASVDSRRAAGAIADALEGAEVDAARVEEATRLRVEATRRVQESVARALGELHALLEADQREELASLIRSGEIQL
jgi:Spy/CpxP family protein refolding chaperone